MTGLMLWFENVGQNVKTGRTICLKKCLIKIFQCFACRDFKGNTGSMAFIIAFDWGLIIWRFQNEFKPILCISSISKKRTDRIFLSRSSYESIFE